MSNKKVPPHPSRFVKSRQLAEMTKPRHAKIKTFLLRKKYLGLENGWVWYFGLQNEPGRSRVPLLSTFCEPHECRLRHKTHEITNGKPRAALYTPKTDRLSVAWQEDSYSRILFVAVVFPEGLLRPRQNASVGGCSCWTRDMQPFCHRGLTSSTQTLLCKQVLLDQLVNPCSQP